MSADYYQTLGVPRDATPEQIKKAYRKLAMKYHPDVADAPDAADRFKEIGEAYEVLHDPSKRAMYDRGGDPMGGGFGGGGGAYGFSGGGFDFTQPRGRDVRPQASRGPRSRVRRGQDALVRLTLTLAEAAFGITKPLKVDTAVVCPRCSGTGANEGSEPITCTTCHGAGDVTPGAALVPRRDPHQPALPELPRLRHDHPQPVRRVLRRGPRAQPPHHQRQDPGRRCHRQPGAPGLPGRGRAPAAARPATCTSSST